MINLDYAEKDINFREVKAGKIAAGVLYRSSSPLKGGSDKKIKGELAHRGGIRCIINLDDDNSCLEALAKDVPWYNKLVEKKKVIALDMNLTIPSEDFNQKLKKGLQFMLANEGPYLIHCFAGVDRTGFVVAVLEGLMGATLKEIRDNYLLSFEDFFNYSFDYHCNKKKKGFEKQLKAISLGKNKNEDNIMDGALNYLQYDVGLSKDEIMKLVNILGTSP